jgi:hypothetical protein
MNDLPLALQYAESLYGCPYGYHNARSPSSCFYAEPMDTPLPSRERLVTQGVSNTGLLNLLCRHMRIPVPGVRDVAEALPGDIHCWARALPWQRIKSDTTMDPAPGTLFFRYYRSHEDQGHVAIVAHDGNTLLQSYPIPWDPMRRTHGQPGVTFTELPPVVTLEENGEEIVVCHYDVYCPPTVWIRHLLSN